MCPGKREVLGKNLASLGFHTDCGQERWMLVFLFLTMGNSTQKGNQVSKAGVDTEQIISDSQTY